MVSKITLTFSILLLLLSCNKNLTEEEKKELWSKAQTTGEIINRSGTVFNSGSNKELALRDAQNRLQTGGGLFGNKGLSVDGLINNNNNQNQNNASLSMPINSFLWRSALETISFMPLASADPIGGTIITDWYSTEINENERCKINIFITGVELKTQNLKVKTFCQIFKNQNWINKEIGSENNIKLENAILNKAKKLRLQIS